MKREVLYGGLLACGVALMVLSLVLEDHVSDSVGGMFMGAGCSLIGFGGSQFCMRHWEKKDPAAMRQAEIEANDERNVAIGNAAKAKGYDVMTFAFGAMLLFSVLMEADLALTLVMVAVYLFIQFYSLWWRFKLEKEM